MYPALAQAVPGLIRLGWPLVPLGSDKRPLLKNWPDRASLDPDEIGTWLQRWPRAMLAVVCGLGDITVIDVESVAGNGVDGLATLDRLQNEIGALPKSVEVVTPSGGRHLYFAAPADRYIKSRIFADGVEVRGTRGLVAVPPSERADGRAYRWLRNPLQFKLANLPRSWLDLLDPPKRHVVRQAIDLSGERAERYVQVAIRKAVERIASAPNGARNATLNTEAFGLGRLIADALLDPGQAALELANAARAIGLSQGEAAATIASGLRAGSAKPRGWRHG